MDPVNLRDPFPLYGWLREHSPAHRSEPVRAWLLTRYADVRSAFGNPRLFSSQGGRPVLARAEGLPADARQAFAVGYRFVYEQVQAFDAPKHTEQRALVSKAFSVRMLETLRADIERRVHRLIDSAAAKGSFDFVADFAYPLPSQVIFDILGVPPEHSETLRESAIAMARFPPATLSGNVKALMEIAEALERAEALLRRLVHERRESPRRDLLSELASVREGQTRLTDDEIVVLSNVLVFAGHETTTNLLAGAMLHLLQERGQWVRLQEEPEIVPNAIEELLRFVSPVLLIPRTATEDVELHGQVIKKDDRVNLLVGAANHDPMQYENADQLLLDRERPQSVAFGYGVHYCIGAMLARLEAEISLRALAARLPDIELAMTEPEYLPIFHLRALKALPVTTT